MLKQGAGDAHCGVFCSLISLLLVLCGDVPRTGTFSGANVTDPNAMTDIRAFRGFMVSSILEGRLPGIAAPAPPAKK